MYNGFVALDTLIHRNNKGKSGSNFRGKTHLLSTVFPLQHTVTFLDKGGKTTLLCKQSYTYLGDYHSSPRCIVVLPDILHLRHREQLIAGMVLQWIQI